MRSASYCMANDFQYFNFFSDCPRYKKQWKVLFQAVIENYIEYHTIIFETLFIFILLLFTRNDWIFNIVSRFFVVVFLYYGFVLVGSIINSSIFLFECVMMLWQTQPSFWAIYPQEWQASNLSLWYHSWFKHKSHENVWNDHQLGKLSIVKQLSSSERNIFLNEWRGWRESYRWVSLFFPKGIVSDLNFRCSVDLIHFLSLLRK